MKQSAKVQQAIDSLVYAIREDARERVLAALGVTVASGESTAGINTGTKTPSKRGRRPIANSNAGLIRSFLGSHPWSTFGEIKLGTGLQQSQISRALFDGCKAGAIQKKGEPRSQRYALALKAVA
jgi:hypothetical protein